MVLGNYEREEESNYILKREVNLDLIKEEVSRHKNLNLLINDGTEQHVRNSKIFIHGFDNSTYGNEKYSSNNMSSGCDYKILLAHSPNIINFITEHNLDYNHILVGHTHGRQINLSINKTAYDKFHIGFRKLNDYQFFSISRGLGTVRIPIRINSNPTINIYEIKNK